MSAPSAHLGVDGRVAMIDDPRHDGDRVVVSVVSIVGLSALALHADGAAEPRQIRVVESGTASIVTWLAARTRARASRNGTQSQLDLDHLIGRAALVGSVRARRARRR